MRLRPFAIPERVLPVLGLALLAAQPASAQNPDAALAARSLAATCSNCHGTNGQATGVMPALAGMPAERMLALLAAFKSGATPATVMHQITKGYSDDQLRAIASHFAAQKPRP